MVFTVGNGNPPETLPDAYLPLPVPAPGSPTDTDGDGITDETELKYGLDPTNPGDAERGSGSRRRAVEHRDHQRDAPDAPYLRYFAEGINNAVFNTGIAIANSSRGDDGSAGHLLPPGPGRRCGRT